MIKLWNRIKFFIRWRKVAQGTNFILYQSRFDKTMYYQVCFLPIINTTYYDISCYKVNSKDSEIQNIKSIWQVDYSIGESAKNE